MSDITYLRRAGRLYLAVFSDALSRRVVGWAITSQLRMELSTDALQDTLDARRSAPGLITPDRAGRHLSADEVRLRAAYGVCSSVGRPGRRRTMSRRDLLPHT